MTALPLALAHGLLFVGLEERLWLLDTGAPTSFGSLESLMFAGAECRLARSHLGLDAATLSGHVGMECGGLLGMDVLGRFDHILDTAGGRLIVATAELSHGGRTVPLEQFMSIPIVTANVGGEDCRMFFDTGATLSYFQSDRLREFPPAGPVTDFHPMLGRFQTDTHMIPVTLGDVSSTLRCGRLPPLLGAALAAADVAGICGNEVLRDRAVGFFPRRGALCL